MQFAQTTDLQKIFDVFKSKAELAHVRKDRLAQLILSHKCVFENGVVITFVQYKHKTKLGRQCSTRAAVGSVKILHIVNTGLVHGAAGAILDKFVRYVVTTNPVFVCVCVANKNAIKFFESHGFSTVDTIKWNKTGQVIKLDGLIYAKQLNNEK